jgi:hypothetical protein
VELCGGASTAPTPVRVLWDLRRATTVAPDEVEDGERESREEAVRGEGRDEDADGGGVVARVEAVAVVVVRAGDEVGGLLELPPHALEYLPRHCVAAADATVLGRSPCRGVARNVFMKMPKSQYYGCSGGNSTHVLLKVSLHKRPDKQTQFCEPGSVGK